MSTNNVAAPPTPAGFVGCDDGGPQAAKRTLVRWAKLRWRIEHDYREVKTGLGLDHYEGRTWQGWQHHTTLVSAAHAFCTLQRLDPKTRAPESAPCWQCRGRCWPGTVAEWRGRQKEQSFDVIASADTLHCVDGGLVIPRTVPTPTPDGVDMGTGIYGLNDIALAGIGAKLDIPLPYLRRMAGLREPADANLRLLDNNVNSWLERDDRRFLIRLLRDQQAPDQGTARAFLSDRYLRLNHLDVLLAALDGIRQAGVAVQVASCDLTGRRMYVRFVSPEVQVMAPALLRNYRSPFDGRRGSDLPIISAGFLLTNSETGYGRYMLAPYIRVEVCSNGQTVDHAKIGRTHVGTKITDADGIITPSERTIARWLDLIREQTTDAVRAYLDVDFLTRVVHDLQRAAGVAVPKPQATIKIVSQRLRYTQQQQDDILAHFIQGADLTAGGVMQAVTSVARSISDADTAFGMESTATRALRLAAAAA